MAEALGTVTAVFSVVDVTIRVVKLIHEVNNGLGSLSQELEPLKEQVRLLQETSKIIEEYYPTAEITTSSGRESLNQPATKTDLRETFSKFSRGCLVVIQELEKKLAYILTGSSQDSVPLDVASPEGHHSINRLRDLRNNAATLYRYKGAKQDLLNYRQKLETYHQALSLIQQTIAQQSRDIDSHVLKAVAERLHVMDEKLRKLSPREQEEFPNEAGTSFPAAAQALRPIHIRKAVSDIFTGRKAQLELLRQCFFKPGPPGQRRAVIYGVGGSGKTEFCCKFAHDNLKRYWGVFFIDASTPERIEQTFNDIAESAGCDKKARAVLNWLVHLKESWLLVIDNADNLTDMSQLQSLFPNVDRGHILVTTRNPELKYCSTVDHDLFHFENLDHTEATNLLFKAAGARLPWDKSVARQITDHLGNLALAVVYAGTTIRANLVELAGYIGYYKRRLNELRKTRRRLDTRDLFKNNDFNVVIIVFTTLEGCYQRLEKLSSDGFEKATDAMELLKIFAFFHHENISVDIFRRSMLGARMELNKKKTDDETHHEDPLGPQRSWSESIWRFLGVVFEGVVGIGQYCLPLPQVIRAGWSDPDIENNIESYMDRIKLAMKELTHLSLVIYHEHSATYRMHPLVHEWARERPDMQFSDQRMWSDAAARILSASILLPPLGTDVNDDRYVVGLLPHVKHVQERRKLLDDASSRSYAMSWMSLPWKIHTSIIGTERIRMLAKLSMVYAKSGRFRDAETHLSQVVGVLTAYAGEKDSRTRNAKLALSGIYFHLGQPERSAELQEEILEACRAHLGGSHPDTLRAMSRLGQARWLQGRYTEAQNLQRPAVEGMIAQLTPKHPDTLDAIDNLGMTIAKFWRESGFREAYFLHWTALAGMREVHGREHDRTLLATQNLCRTAVMLGSRRRIGEALVMMDEMLEIRRIHCGAEHPMTLLAMVNTAVVRGASGDHESLTAARAMVQGALATAQRNFAEHPIHTRRTKEGKASAGENEENEAGDSTGVGPNHIGILFGQHVLASILAQLGQWAEARDIFAEIQEKQKKMHAHRGDYHPDRLGTLVDLARCHYELGDLDESIEICEYTIMGFEAISVEEHPITEGLRDALEALYSVRSGTEAQAEGGRIIFPWILFPGILKD